MTTTSGTNPDVKTPVHCHACGWHGMLGQTVCISEAAAQCPICRECVEIIRQPVTVKAK